MLDSTSYEGFISEYQLTKGLIIGDKSFPHSTAKEYFEAYPNLLYLNPLKRDSKYINEFDLFNFDGQASHLTHTTKKSDCAAKQPVL